MAISMDSAQPILLSTDASLTSDMIINRTGRYRAAEIAKFESYGEHWSEAADAVQTALMWSAM